MYTFMIGGTLGLGLLIAGLWLWDSVTVLRRKLTVLDEPEPEPEPESLSVQ